MKLVVLVANRIADLKDCVINREFSFAGGRQ